MRGLLAGVFDDVTQVYRENQPTVPYAMRQTSRGLVGLNFCTDLLIPTTSKLFGGTPVTLSAAFASAHPMLDRFIVQGRRHGNAGAWILLNEDNRQWPIAQCDETPLPLATLSAPASDDELPPLVSLRTTTRAAPEPKRAKPDLSKSC